MAANRTTLAAALVAWLLPAWAAAQEPPAAPRTAAFEPLAAEAFRNDATLNDVCFVDPQNGWAVGDRGTILRTADGGRHWSAQASGVNCRLESVSFVNAEQGWAAGGTVHPRLNTGAGVLLATQDGGKHWTYERKLLLPYLKRVRFLGPRTGWAICCPSALFPSGVLISESGGRSWNPVLGPRAPGWIAGDFLAPELGAVAGGRTVVSVRDGRFQLADVPELGLRAALRLKLSSQGPAWLVGQGGLVLASGDGGTTWVPPVRGLPEQVAGQFDFSALEVQGPRCWIAGSPGSRVFHSPDGGQRWFAAPTGQNLPLCAMAFVGDSGWAVGALGTILSTTDGGQNWTRQRGGGSRLAVLGVFGEPADVPLELFARLGGNEGYLSAVELLHRRDLDVPPRDDISLDDRAREALLCVGGSGARMAWQFPLRQPGLELPSAKVRELWDGLHNGRGQEAYEAHLVRQIRLWRPEIVVTQEVSAVRPMDRAVNEAVLRAAGLAADPNAYREQIAELGLAPWQVRRVYVTAAGGQGTTTIASSQMADRLGQAVGDLADDARGLLFRRPEPGPATLGFHLVYSSTGEEQTARDFFSGLNLAAGGDARRVPLEPNPETIDRVRRLAQKRRTIEAIVERSQRDPRGAAGLLAQADELVRGLDPETAAEILDRLGYRYLQTGRWPLAAEIYVSLADRHADQPLARSAMLWLVGYYTSGEAACRRQLDQRIEVQQASTFSATPIPLDSQERLARAATLGTRLQETQPELFAEPSVAFALAAAERKRRQERQAERLLAPRRNMPHDAWWACAQGETWLTERRGQPPKPAISLPTAQGRPRLDGRLDEPLWRSASQIELHSPMQDDETWPATVHLARDDQFLYLSVEARRAPGASYPPMTGRRGRDADLGNHDRVELLIDIDRDYTSYYRLAFDHRGATAEDCWGDPTWDPNWYVAAGSGESSWIVEAAIPLQQIAGTPPAPGTAWALGVQRIVPGVGFQSWTVPAAIEPQPEGFGYLLW